MTVQSILNDLGQKIPFIAFFMALDYSQAGANLYKAQFFRGKPVPGLRFQYAYGYVCRKLALKGNFLYVSCLCMVFLQSNLRFLYTFLMRKHGVYYVYYFFLLLLLFLILVLLLLLFFLVTNTHMFLLRNIHV